MNQNTQTKQIKLEKFTKSDYDAFSGVVEIDNKALIGEFEHGLVIVDDEKVEIIFLDPSNISENPSSYSLFNLPNMFVRVLLVNDLGYYMIEEDLEKYGFVKIL